MQEKTIKRLSVSKYNSNFVLKGGLLFLIINNTNIRVTKDIDFLGIHINNTEENIIGVFSEIINLQFDDGLVYDDTSIKCLKIKEDADYHGIRVMFNCKLGNIKKKIQIDIGYGDKVYPSINKTSYPSLLDEDILNVNVYSVETSISEKFEAMVKLLYTNSRMKDFFDIYTYITTLSIKEVDILNAVKITFENRGTEIEDYYDLFQEDFINDSKKNMQWKAFSTKNNIQNLTFEYVANILKSFFDKIIDDIINIENKYSGNWNHQLLKWE